MRTLSAIFSRAYPDPFFDLENNLKDGVNKIFPSAKLSEAIRLVAPPDHIQADFSFSAFSLSSVLRDNPSKISLQISEYFSENQLPIIESIFAVGPYVNIKINKHLFNKQVVNHICNLGKTFGISKDIKGELTVINYNSPDFLNSISFDGIRQILVGHVISTVHKALGNSISEVFFFADWEMQALKFLYALEKWPDEIQKKYSPIEVIKFADSLLSKKDSHQEALNAKIKIFFRDLQNGDKKLVRLFQVWRNKVLNYVKSFHKKLGLNLDSYYTESDFIEASTEVVNDALDSKIAKHLDHTNAVLIEGHNEMPSLVLRKHDNSETHATRRLAFLKSIASIKSPKNLILISPTHSVKLAYEILVAAKALQYLSLGQSSSLLPIAHSGPENEIKKFNDKAVHYAILRTPLDKKVSLDDVDLDIFNKIKNYLSLYKSINKNPTDEDEFRITKLLISYPSIILKVRQLNSPDLLCIYLEELIEECENSSIYLSPKLKKALGSVIANTLKLLTF